MRRALIAGNWKMNGTVSAAASLLEGISKVALREAEMLICPPFTALMQAAPVCEKTGISLGAQNVYPKASGAFTGEISPAMLSEIGCAYCIVGHSERRQLLGETSAFVNEKVHALLETGISPILCVGETAEERAAEKTEAAIAEEIEVGLADVSKEETKHIVIAYEPIWAIGTGASATAEEAERVCRFIRNLLETKYGDAAAEMRILYGGSVNGKNASDFFAKEDIDGALIGGASLKAEEFISIYEKA